MFTYMTHAVQASRVRVSNYYACVLRIVQRDAKANGMFVQLTSPWRQQVPLRTLCHEWGSSEEFGWIIREWRCAFSFSFILRWFDALWSGGSRGEASPRIPTGHIFTSFLLEIVLLCAKGLSRNSFAGERRADLSARLCAALPSLSTDDANVWCITQLCSQQPKFGAGNQTLLVCPGYCSWTQPFGWFPRHSVEMASLQGAKAGSLLAIGMQNCCLYLIFFFLFLTPLQPLTGSNLKFSAPP